MLKEGWACLYQLGGVGKECETKTLWPEIWGMVTEATNEEG